MLVPKWIRQLSMTTISLPRSVDTKHCSTYARNISPVMAPSITIGAVILLCRKAATNVTVSHAPSGTLPITLTPRGARPLNRLKLVLAAVSSINTSRAGSSSPCSRIQRRRARSTSARCRSAACRLFFKRDVVSIEKPPERATAGSNPPLAQLCNGLLQSEIRRFRLPPPDRGGELFKRGCASAAWLRRGAPFITPALQPPYPGAHAQLATVPALDLRPPTPSL